MNRFLLQNILLVLTVTEIPKEARVCIVPLTKSLQFPHRFTPHVLFCPKLLVTSNDFLNINSPLSFDPASLITLFFDSGEKDLVARSGDLNLLSWFDLFVNPSTVWCEYGAMYPDQGLRYYVPDSIFTSTIEVIPVHEFLLRLGPGRKNCGIITAFDCNRRVNSPRGKARPGCGWQDLSCLAYYWS